MKVEISIGDRPDILTRWSKSASNIWFNWKEHHTVKKGELFKIPEVMVRIFLKKTTWI